MLLIRKHHQSGAAPSTWTIRDVVPGVARWDWYLPPAPHAGKVTRALITSPDITLP